MTYGDNSPFNEAGEPIMDAAAWRYEQELDFESQFDSDPYDDYDRYDYDPDE